MKERYADQQRRLISGVWREMLGKAMGNVFRPTSLSPGTSWKSCAWMVVAKMAEMMKIEKDPVKSNFDRSEAEKGPLEYYELDYDRKYKRLQAIKVDPMAKQAYPTAFIRFLLSQCWSPWSSWYMGMRRAKNALA